MEAGKGKDMDNQEGRVKCPECGFEMVKEVDGWICNECGHEEPNFDDGDDDDDEEEIEWP